MLADVDRLPEAALPDNLDGDGGSTLIEAEVERIPEAALPDNLTLGILLANIKLNTEFSAIPPIAA